MWGVQVRDGGGGGLSISESVLGARGVCRRVGTVGFDGFLVGGAMMQSNNPGDALRTLIKTSSHPLATTLRSDVGDAN